MANRSLGTLTLDLIARVGGFTRGMTQAERVAYDRSRAIERNFKRLQRSVTGVFSAIGGAALIRSIVRNTAEAEQQLAQLDAVLHSTGQAAGYSRAQLVAMSEDLAKVTKFSSGEIQEAQTRLLTYTTIVGKTFPAALQVAIDQSERLGITVEQSAEIIGKALEKPSRGVASLSRQGFQFSESQKSLLRSLEAVGRTAEAQQIVLDVLNESYGGAARAARDTFGGALAGLKNAFNDLLQGGSGVPATTEAINQLTETLTDPAVKRGVDDLAAGLFTIGRGWALLAGLIGEKIRGSGLSEELEAAYKRQEQVSASIGRLYESMQALRSAGKENSRNFIEQSESLERLKGRLAETQAEIKKLTAADPLAEVEVAASRTGVAAALPPPPSEEFLQLSARLKEQIALYGSVGEAAKVRYAIESGALGTLDKAKENELLALASQLDSLVQNTDAMKQQAEAQQKLTETFESQEESLVRQLTLTAEATELERLRYEFANGALAGLSDAQKARLEGLAEEVDLLKQRTEIESRVAAVVEDTLTPLEQYQRRIEELNDLFRESNELLGESGLSFETYKRAVEQAQKELEDATHKSNEFLLEAARGTQNILADSIFGAMQGEIDNIGKAFKRMLDQLVAQALAAQLAQKLFGDIGQNSVGGGGWVDQAISWGSKIFGGGRESGGAVSAGMLYEVNEHGGVEGLRIPGGEDYLFMGNRSGQVIPAARIDMGGNRPGVTQNITVQGSVSQRNANQLAAEAAMRQRIAMARFK